MANIIGRGIKVEIAATYGAAINLTGISKAAQAVILTTTPPAINSVGFLSAVGGMAQAEGQAVRVKTVVAATSFVAQNFDTQSYSDFAGTAQFTPVATWEPLIESTAYQQSGGDAPPVDVSRLIDEVAQEESGLLGAQNYSIPILAQDVPSAAQQLLDSAAIAQGYVVVRITFNKTGAVRVFRSQPSLSSEDVTQGQAGTGTLSLKVKGRIIKAAA